MPSHLPVGSKTPKNWLPEILGLTSLFLVWLVVLLANFSSTTWLLSWDVMATEFNPGLAIWRSLTGSWQSYQGLGVLGGHGYAAMLPHALFQMIVLVVLPLQYARYAFTFLMLLAGTLGAFWLARYSLGTLVVRNRPWLRSGLALLVGFMYLLHPATIQTFYVHLEPFIVMYGLGPWVLWWLFQVLEQPSVKKYLVWLGLQFGLSVIGFIPPVFVLFSVLVGLIMGWAVVLRQFSVKSLVTTLTLGLVLVLAQLYWLLPVSVFSLTQSDDYLSANLNQLSTQENVLKSEHYGQLSQLAWPKSFYFDSLDQDRFELPTQFSYTFQPWIDHFSLGWTWWVGALLISMAVFGWLGVLAVGSWQRKPVAGLGFAGVATGLLMARGQPELTWLYAFLDTIPVLNQAFRLPFSKLSMLYSLFLSLGVGLGLLLIWWGLLKLHKLLAKSALVGLVMVVALSVIGLSAPSFAGHFLYQGARVQLPQAYREVAQILRQESDYGRVAPFPILTTSGWDMHQWIGDQGYTGSGFWWYAQPHPMLHRSFDVWNPTNENYRLQMAEAVYAQDVAEFERLLELYQVKWILIDNTVFLPNVRENLFYRDQLRAMIEQLQAVETTYASPELELYTLTAAEYSRVWSPAEAVTVQDQTKRSRVSLPSIVGESTVYSENGLILPFANLGQQQLQGVSETDQTVNLESQQLTTGSYWLMYPGAKSNVAFKVGVQLDVDQPEIILEPILPSILIEDEVVIAPEILVVPLPVQTATHFSLNNYIYKLPNDLSTPQYLGPLYLSVGESLQLNTYNQANFNSVELSQSDSDTTFSLDETSLVRLNWPTASLSKEKTICISLKTNYSCLNQVNLIRPDSDVSELLALSQGEYRLSGSLLDEISPEELVIGWSQPIGSQELDPSFWTHFTQEISLDFTIDQPLSITATIPKLGLGWVPDDVETTNCSFLKQGRVDRELDPDGQSIQFWADDGGIICDAYFFQQAPLETGLLTTISASNQDGLTLKLYLKDLVTDRTQLETYLDETKDSVKHWFSTLPMKGSGLALTVDNRSIHTYESENSLYNISIFVAPIHELLNTRLEPKSNIQPLGMVEIKSVWSLGTGIVRLELSNQNQRNGLLALAESSNPGWLGYSLNHGWLKKTIVDDWANGWLVPAGEQTVILFFWPQLLSLGGFFGLIVLSLALTGVSLRKTNKLINHAAPEK